MTTEKNEIGIIVWHLEAKNLIKIEGQDDSYKLSDKVISASDFKKYPLKKGDKVSYAVTDKVVTYLKKETTGKQKEVEPKVETPTESVTPESVTPETTVTVESSQLAVDEEVFTIHAIAANRQVLKFKENSTVWVKISLEIQAQDYKDIGLIARQRVAVKIVNNTIISLKSVQTENTEANAPKNDPKPTTNAPTASNNAQNIVEEPLTKTDAFYRVKELERQVRYLQNEKSASIEAQASVNSANEVIGRIASSMDAKPPASKIVEMIEAIAIANFNLIQKIKNTSPKA